MDYIRLVSIIINKNRSSIALITTALDHIKKERGWTTNINIIINYAPDEWCYF